MHVSPEYGVIELAPDGDDGEHEILATGLINDAMPFLRYRTGDRALLGDAKACSCGRGLPTFGTLIGRIDENVITPEGVPVGPTALGLAFKVVPHLAESQVVQDSPDRITIRIVTEPGWCEADADVLVTEFRKRLGARIAIVLEPVAAIPRTSGGKQRLIVSSLKRA
jgi:phenylacetate-CoA ligase